MLGLLAMGPFEKNHPLVDDGEAAFERGDYESALEKFDAADKELPNNAQVAFDRGTALHKLGRHDEARAAFLKAAELNQGKQPLDSKIHYNLGNSWAATSNKKEAVAEYRKALRRDPNDELARHNLEVVLKDLPPPQSSGADGGSAPDGGGRGDGGHHDGGTDGGKPADGGRPVDGGQGDSGVGDGGSDGGADGGQGPGDGGAGDGGQKGDGGQGQGETGQDGGGQGGERGDGGSDGGSEGADGGTGEGEAAEVGDGGEQMSKKEAERMLDALKNTERNMQLWRFRPDAKDKRKRPNEKDW